MLRKLTKDLYAFEGGLLIFRPNTGWVEFFINVETGQTRKGRTYPTLKAAERVWDPR